MKELINAVEQYKELILNAERWIWAHPETGYREVETSAYMAEQFRALGYELTMAEGITGFYTVLDTGREGPEVMILRVQSSKVFKHELHDINIRRKWCRKKLFVKVHNRYFLFSRKCSRQ